MAFASDSTSAPARPLLPLPDLDHVAEGMRWAWTAARGLLQAAASAPGASDASALASESVAAASASHRPDQIRSVDDPDRIGVVPIYPATSRAVPSLLPLPAPLPSLTAALSRRRAVFGTHDGVDA